MDAIQESKGLGLEKEIDSLTRELSTRYEELLTLYRVSAQLKEHPTSETLFSLILKQVDEIIRTKYLSFLMMMLVIHGRRSQEDIHRLMSSGSGKRQMEKSPG